MISLSVPKTVAYTKVNTVLQIGDVVKDVHLRASKNCPWLGELWVGYMLCLERCSASETEISAVRISLMSANIFRKDYMNYIHYVMEWENMHQLSLTYVD